MPFNGVAFFVEGDDDRRFVEQVAEPCIGGEYDDIKVVEWSSLKPRKIEGMITAYREMGYCIVFLGDLDDAPCITEKSRSLVRSYGPLRREEVVVAVPEIEAWYIAGAPRGMRAQFPPFVRYSTERVTKELFNSCVPDEISSILVFKRLIVEQFNTLEARQKSASLNYLVELFA